MRKFYKNRSAVVSKLTGVGSPLRLNRFSRIEFPIYVGIGTQTTFMQKTILASIHSARVLHAASLPGRVVCCIQVLLAISQIIVHLALVLPRQSARFLTGCTGCSVVEEDRRLANRLDLWAPTRG